MSLPKRKSRKLSINEDIYIFTEGTATEVIYFERIRQLLRVPTVKIKVKGTGQSSLKLIDYADRFIKRQSNIKSVWVVFDKDDLSVTQIEDAYKEAKIKHFQIAFSNICFEVWFLLHFETLSSNTCTEKKTVYSKLEKHLNIKDYEKKHKSDMKLIQDIADKYKVAVINNEMLLESSKTPYGTPYTNIGNLIKYLST